MSARTRPSVVVDTNILVSGTIIPHGDPHRLLTAWEQGQFHLLIAPELVSEVERVLHRDRIRRKYHLTTERISALVDRLHAATQSIEPLHHLPLSSRDPKDDKFLAVALAGPADYLVTGDEDLLVLNGDPRLGTLQIVKVRAFLDVLAG